MEVFQKSLTGVIIGLENKIKDDVYSRYIQDPTVKEEEGSSLFVKGRLSIRIRKINSKIEEEQLIHHQRNVDFIVIVISENNILENFVRIYCENIVKSFNEKEISLVCIKNSKTAKNVKVGKQLIKGVLKKVKYYETTLDKIPTCFERIIKYILFLVVQKSSFDIKQLKDEINLQENLRKQKIRDLCNLNEKCNFWKKKLWLLYDKKIIGQFNEMELMKKKIFDLQKRVNSSLLDKKFKDINSLIREANRLFQKIKIREFKKYKIIIDFNKPLHSYLKAEKGVPKFLMISIEYIIANFLHVEDIFYKQCSVKVLEETKKSFRNKISIHLPKLNIHVLTTLIKEWIYNLSTPLIEGYDKFLNYFKENNEVEFKKQVYMLPKINFDVLKLFFGLFRRILKRSSENKSSEERIARIFSQIFFFKKTQFVDLIEKEKEMKLENILLEFINKTLLDSKNIFTYFIRNSEFLFKENYFLERKRIEKLENERKKREDLEYHLENLNWKKIIQIMKKRYMYLFYNKEIEEKKELLSSVKKQIFLLESKVKSGNVNEENLKRLKGVYARNYVEVVDLIKKLKVFLVAFEDKELKQIIYIFKLILVEKNKNQDLFSFIKQFEKIFKLKFGSKVYSKDSLNVKYSTVYSKLISQLKEKKYKIQRMKFNLKNKISDDVIDENEIEFENQKIKEIEDEINEINLELKEFEDDNSSKFFKVYKEQSTNDIVEIKREIIKEVRKLENEKKRLSLLNEVNFIIPKQFFCPLTKQIMENPYILIDSGNTYEKSAIEEYLKDNDVEPITKKKLKIKRIVPNTALKNAALGLNVHQK